MTLPALDEAWDRALAVLAHPDDAEYSGIAAAAARWTGEGKWVGYLLVTRGEAGMAAMAPVQAGPLRMEEQRRAARTVGVRDVEFLDHPDGMIEPGATLRCDIARALRRHHPDVVLTLSPEFEAGSGRAHMADHRIVAVAVLDAVRDAANRWLCRSDGTGEPEAWEGISMVCCAASQSPTHVVDVTGSVEVAVRSLRQHEAYLGAVGGPDAASRVLREGLARGGKLSGTEAALALRVYRT